MALMRRHWKLFAFNVLLMLGAISALVWHLVQRPEVTMAQPAPPEPTPVDALTFSRVQTLRSVIALDNTDLAAMDCTQQQAEEVLTAVLSWTRTNAASLGETEAAIATAEAALRDALQSRSRGEEVSANQVATLKTALTTALEARATLTAGLATAVTGELTQEQAGMWTTAKANHSLPAKYRFVPNLSAAETATLQLTTARGNAEAIASAEQNIITGPRAAAMATAQSNLSERIEAVMAGAASSIPTPNNP